MIEIDAACIAGGAIISIALSVAITHFIEKHKEKKLKKECSKWKKSI